MSEYFLMHEDNRVALFDYDWKTVSNVFINDNNFSRLPLGVIYNHELKSWIENRVVPNRKGVIKKELADRGDTSTLSLAIQNYGLSLTDHYWYCKIFEDIRWADINKYENPFDSGYNLELGCKSGNVSESKYYDLNPNYTLRGRLKKNWWIDKYGDRVLLKGSKSQAGFRQSVSEVFASILHRNQGTFDYVEYNLHDMYNYNKAESLIGCTCKNFTDRDLELVHASDIAKCFKKDSSVSSYEHYIKYCNKRGVDLRSFMEYQIMTDFLITNTDRHFNNFGILRDSHSLEWLKPAPIFDSGNSLFHNTEYIPKGRELLNIKVTSFKGKEVNLLQYVTNRGLVDISKLPSDFVLYNLLMCKDTVSERDAEEVVKAYLTKIQYLTDFQNGADIWSYNYKG